MLEISRELASIAQAGIAYLADPFDKERFHRLREIASEVLRHAGRTEFQWPAEIGYSTPKVDVRGAVFRNGEVLLIKEASSGKWTLPGGWADVNLTPAENVEKECLEESGYEVKARLITAIVDHDRAGYPANPAFDLQDLLPLRSLRWCAAHKPRNHGSGLFFPSTLCRSLILTEPMLWRSRRRGGPF